MSQPIDTALLERVLAAVAPEDAAALSAALEPAWKARQRRRYARAVALRAALALTGPTGLYKAACQLDRDLARRAASRTPATTERQVLVDDILRLNEGRPIGWRTILRELEETAVTVKNSDGDDSSFDGL